MNTEVSEFLEASRLEVPFVHGDLGCVLKLCPFNDIEVVSLPPLTNDLFRAIIVGDSKFTFKELVAYYSRLNYAITNGVNFKYFFGGDVLVIDVRRAFLHLQMSLGRISCIPEKTDEKIDTYVELLPHSVVKDDPNTYADESESYVRENYNTRITQLAAFLPLMISRFKIDNIIAPNDGAGVCSNICARIRGSAGTYPICKAYDPSPFMVDQARQLKNDVTLGGFFKHCQQPGVIFVSHSEKLDPGLVALAISMRKHVIVFEMGRIYPGYHLLKENSFGIRSTFDIILPSRPLYSDVGIRYSYYDMTKNGLVYYVSDHRVVSHLSHLVTIGLPFILYTRDYKTQEIAMSKGYDVRYGLGPKDAVGLYLTKIDAFKELNYNIPLNYFHPVLTHYQFVEPYFIVAGMKAKKYVRIMNSYFSLFERRPWGYNSQLSYVPCSFYDVRLTNVIEEDRDVPPEYLLVDFIRDGKPLTKLTNYEKDLLGVKGNSMDISAPNMFIREYKTVHVIPRYTLWGHRPNWCRDVRGDKICHALRRYDGVIDCLSDILSLSPLLLNGDPITEPALVKFMSNKFPRKRPDPKLYSGFIPYSGEPPYYTRSNYIDGLYTYYVEHIQPWVAKVYPSPPSSTHMVHGRQGVGVVDMKKMGIQLGVK